MNPRRSQIAEWLGLIVIVFAIGVIAYLWVMLNRPIDLYATVDAAENKFIGAVHVSEEARLYMRKAAEYSLQLAVIDVSENGGFIRATQKTPLGKPVLTTRTSPDFPEKCPDDDRAYTLTTQIPEVSGPLQNLVESVLGSIRQNFPKKLNEYADLLSEYEVSNKVNLSVYDNSTSESLYKKSCLFLDRPTEAAIAKASDAGAVWVKLPVKWREIQPEEGGEYDWDEIDTFYQSIDGRGIEVIPVLGWAPDWAVSDADLPLDSSRNTAPKGTRIPEFAKFAGDFVSHVSEKYEVNYLVPWQLPNIAEHWSRAGIEPIAFARLFRLTSLSVRESSPSTKIIFPGLAPVPNCGYDRYPDDPKSFSPYLDSSVTGCRGGWTGLKYLERCSTSYMTHENIDCLPTLNVDCTRPDTPTARSGNLKECQSSDYWPPYMYDASLRPENYTRFRYGSLSDFDFLKEMYYSGLSDYFDIIEFYATGSESPDKEYGDCDPAAPATCKGFGRLKLLRNNLLGRLEGDREIFITGDWPGISPEAKQRSFVRAVYSLARTGELGETGPICVPEKFSDTVSSMRSEPSFSPWGELYGTANHTTRVSTLKRANEERYFTGYGLVYSEDNSTGGVGFSMTEILKEARLIAKNPERIIVPNSVSCTSDGGKCISGFFKRSDANSCDLGKYLCPEGGSGGITCEGQLSAPYRMSCELKAQVYNYSCAVDSAEYPGTTLNEAIVNPNSCYEDEKTGAMGICVSNAIECIDMNPYSRDKGSNQFRECRNINDHCCVFGYDSTYSNDPFDYEKKYSIANPSSFETCLCASIDEIKAPPTRTNRYGPWPAPFGPSSLDPWQGSGSREFWVNCEPGKITTNCCDPSDPIQSSVCNWWVGANGWSATSMTSPQLGTNYDDGSAYKAGCRNAERGGKSTPIELCFKGSTYDDQDQGWPTTCPGIFEGSTCDPEQSWKINWCKKANPDPCTYVRTESECPTYTQENGYSSSIVCTGLANNCFNDHGNSDPLDDTCDPKRTCEIHTCEPQDANPSLRPNEATHVPCGDRTENAKGLCVTNPIEPEGNPYSIPNYKTDWSIGYLKPGMDSDAEWWQALENVKYRDGAGDHAGETLKKVAQGEYDKIAASPESVLLILSRAAELESRNTIPDTDNLPKEFLLAISAAENGVQKCIASFDGGVGLFALQANQFCGKSAFLMGLPGYDPSASYGRTNILVKADSQGCQEETMAEDRAASASWSCAGGAIDSAYWRLPDVQVPMISKLLSGYYSSLSNCPGYLAYVASSHNAGAGRIAETNDGVEPSCEWKLPVFTHSSYGYGPAVLKAFTEYPAKVLAWKRVFDEAYEYFENSGPGIASINDVVQASTAGRPWGNVDGLPDPLSFKEITNYDLQPGMLLNICADYYKGPGNQRTCWFAPPLPTLNQARFSDQKQLDVKLTYLDCEVTITNTRWALSSLLRENPLDSETLEGIPNEFKFGLQFAYTNRDCERGIGADISTPAVAKVFGSERIYPDTNSECLFMSLPAKEAWSIDPPGVGTNKYYLPDMGPSSGVDSYIPGCCGYDKAESVVGTIDFTSSAFPQTTTSVPTSTPSTLTSPTPNPGPYCNPVPGGNHGAAGSQYCAARGYGSTPTEPDHKAVDFYADEGTSILASQSGTILYAFDSARTSHSIVLAGSSPVGTCYPGQVLDLSLYTYEAWAASENKILIDHGDGKFTTYFHLQPNSIPAKFKTPGARVERGEVIAKVGIQGIAHCPHLHFTMEGAYASGDTGCDAISGASGTQCCYGETGRPTMNPGPYLGNDCGTSGIHPGGGSTGRILNGDDALCGGDWLGSKFYTSTARRLPTDFPPYPNPITPGKYANPSPYGGVSWGYCQGGSHKGLDIAVSPEGAPLYADFDGIIEFVNDKDSGNCWAGDGSFDPEYGSCPGCGVDAWDACYDCTKNMVVIRHPDGRRSLFLHIMPESAVVEKDQEVKTGDPIARMGNQGCSSGPHVHYEVQGPRGSDGKDCSDYYFSGQVCCRGSWSTTPTVDPAVLIGIGGGPI